MTIKPPAVSIVIPTYNRAPLIGRSIRSVLNQVYQDFELIVVDDSSSDNTRDVLAQFTDTRLRYVCHERTMGAGAARNTGIKAAVGDYLAFHDSDDEWLPDKLERQMQVFATVSPQVGVVYSDMWRIVQNNKTYFKAPHFMPEDGIIYNKALGRQLFGIGIQSTVIRKQCFKEAGVFDESLPALEDSELLMRLSKHYQFYHLAEPLVNYYSTPGSLMYNCSAVAQAWKLILDKHYLDIIKEKKLIATHQINIGLWQYLAGNPDEGRRYLAEAAVADLIEAYRSLIVQARALPFSRSFIPRAIIEMSLLATRARFTKSRRSASS